MVLGGVRQCTNCNNPLRISNLDYGLNQTDLPATLHCFLHTISPDSSYRFLHCFIANSQPESWVSRWLAWCPAGTCWWMWVPLLKPNSTLAIQTKDLAQNSYIKSSWQTEKNSSYQTENIINPQVRATAQPTDITYNAGISYQTASYNPSYLDSNSAPS